MRRHPPMRQHEMRRPTRFVRLLGSVVLVLAAAPTLANPLYLPSPLISYWENNPYNEYADYLTDSRWRRPTVLYDVNGDSFVTSEDLTLLGQYLNGIVGVSALTCPDAADINRNGDINNDSADIAAFYANFSGGQVPTGWVSPAFDRNNTLGCDNDDSEVNFYFLKNRVLDSNVTQPVFVLNPNAGYLADPVPSIATIAGGPQFATVSRADGLGFNLFTSAPSTGSLNSYGTSVTYNISIVVPPNVNHPSPEVGAGGVFDYQFVDEVYDHPTSYPAAFEAYVQQQPLYITDLVLAPTVPPPPATGNCPHNACLVWIADFFNGGSSFDALVQAYRDKGCSVVRFYTNLNERPDIMNSSAFGIYRDKLAATVNQFRISRTAFVNALDQGSWRTVDYIFRAHGTDGEITGTTNYNCGEYVSDKTADFRVDRVEQFHAFYYDRFQNGIWGKTCGGTMMDLSCYGGLAVNGIRSAHNTGSANSCRSQPNPGHDRMFHLPADRISAMSTGSSACRAQTAAGTTLYDWIANDLTNGSQNILSLSQGDHLSMFATLGGISPSSIPLVDNALNFFFGSSTGLVGAGYTDDGFCSEQDPQFQAACYVVFP